MKNDDFGNRMKSYESEWCGDRIAQGEPVLIRLDGKAFHTLTRDLYKPFDYEFMRVMDKTAEDLVEFTNARLSYV